MPKAMPGELGPGWRRGAAEDKALLRGAPREGEGCGERERTLSLGVNSFTSGSYFYTGFWLAFFFYPPFTDFDLVCGKKALEMCGNLQGDNGEKHTHQQSTGALMILKVPDI